MTIADHHRNVVSGRARGPLAMLERAALRLAEIPYRAGVGLRNRAFDQHRREIVRLNVPVLSVGNITVGGTGKTPTVIWLARHLLQRGHKPAVLSRGYKADADQSGDEARVLARQLPDVPHACDADRVEAGRRAIRAHHADILLLDDGFQHRRLHRDLDIVLLDATCPFGFEHVLPRGLLREPPESLGRADLLVVTRADQISAEQMTALTARLTGLTPSRPIVRCMHQPETLVDLAGRTINGVDLMAERVLLFSAIGNPEAFALRIRSMGIRTVGAQAWPDHHRYTLADARRLCEQAVAQDATLLLTTEKDAVKLLDLAVDWPCPVAAQRINIRFLDEDEAILLEAVDRVLEAAEK